MAEQTGKTSLNNALRKLYQLLILDRRDISAIYLFAILSGLVQLSVPIGIQSIIGFVQAADYSTSIVLLIALVVIGVFINGLLQVRQMQVIEKIEQKIFVRYAFEFTDRIPKLDIKKLDNYYLPEVMNRFFDTMTLQKGISKLLLDIPAAAIQIIFGLTLLSLYHPVFIAFGLFLFLILFLILRLTAAKGMETSLRESDYKYAVAGWLQEMGRTIKTFKFSKGTKLHLEETDRLTTGYLESRTAHFRVLMSQYWSLISFKTLITAAMLIVGSVLLVNQQLNIGQFIAAEIIILTVIGAIEKFITSLDKVYDVLTATEKLGKVTNAPIEESGSIDLPSEDKGVSVKFENLSFSFPSNPSVLNNISFSAMAGQRIAIMGNSGSGKSMLLRMLTGTYRDFTGNIFIESIPIQNFTLSSLRNQTGILLNLQDIFKGSLLHNISMGNNNINITQITSIAERLGFIDEMQSLPNGFESILDPAGKRLPKKILQQILLMRALLGNHRLLLLEDPCNHLAPEEKEAVLNCIRQELNATVIISTNDPSVAKVCDKIIVLKNGTVETTGNWNDLDRMMFE